MSTDFVVKTWNYLPVQIFPCPSFYSHFINSFRFLLFPTILSALSYLALFFPLSLPFLLKHMPFGYTSKFQLRTKQCLLFNSFLFPVPYHKFLPLLGLSLFSFPLPFLSSLSLLVLEHMHMPMSDPDKLQVRKEFFSLVFSYKTRCKMEQERKVILSWIILIFCKYFV